MQRNFNVYKGLQRPLAYKGFQGKFIYWGIGSVLCGLLIGAITMAVFSMLLGVLLLAGCIGGGLFYTLSMQKKGLHDKTRCSGVVFFHQHRIVPGFKRVAYVEKFNL
jgi:hypothetical protein